MCSGCRCSHRTIYRPYASKRRKVDTRSMRFRATLASLLTVMMLSLSPAAANCEIRCDLESAKSAAPSCHEAAHQAEAQQETMPGMAGMEHHTAGDHIAADVSAIVWQLAHCAHHVCAQAPALLMERSAVVGHAPAGCAATCANPLGFASDPTIGSFFGRGPPPYRRATPVSLHTTLLI